MSHAERIRRAVDRLSEAGIRVSLFIDPDLKQIEMAAKIKAPVIEIHTGRYADVSTDDQRLNAYDEIVEAANLAHELGLVVNAGHGLHYQNVQRIASIPIIRELNIGHAIVARAVMTGMHEAVSKMKTLMLDARR